MFLLNWICGLVEWAVDGVGMHGIYAWRGVWLHYECLVALIAQGADQGIR